MNFWDMFGGEPEPASIQDVEAQYPGRWPFWYVERYTRFTDTLARVGCPERRREIRWRGRQPSLTLGRVYEGERAGTNFFHGSAGDFVIADDYITGVA